MTDLSPEAQAVLDAYDHSPPCMDLIQCDRNALAAAIRALALHLHAEEYETCGGCSYALLIEQDDILAIADELERKP